MGHLPGGDISLLRGDSWAVRRSADEIRSTVTELTTARAAAQHVEAITSGHHWRGAAFDAFCHVVSRGPLSPAIDRAIASMHEAADQLVWFADRFDHHQAELRWCRSRRGALVAALAQIEAAVAVAPELTGHHDHRVAEIGAELAAVHHRADDAWRGHHTAVEVVRDTFDRLDDQPTFATPPPSTLERIGGAAAGFVEDVVGGVARVTVGLAEGTRDLVVGLVEVVELLNPITAPSRLQDAWNHRDQIIAVLRYARHHPGDFFGELGRAMLDLDMLVEDPARWVGRRIPDILLTVATGGLGRVGSTAATSVRALRGARVADRAGDLAALIRTDTVIGKLATRFDELGRVAEVTRQLPGMLDGLLTGAPALSPEMLGAMRAMAGVQALDRVAAVQELFDDLAEAAHLGTAA